MKVLILNAITSDTASYNRGDKLNLSDADAIRLINAGHAIRLVEFATILEEIETAVEAAGYTAITVPTGMVLPSGSAIDPSGSYFWRDSKINIVHPSGQHAVLDIFHLTPAARP